jgi:hypothetical protein
MTVSTLAKERYGKRATETRTLVFDFSPVLYDSEVVQTINSVTASPSGPTISGEAISAAAIDEPPHASIAAGEAVTCLIAGGTAGTRYTVTAQVQTNGGQILEIDAIIDVD